MYFEKAKKQFPNVKKNEPLKNHSTFRVGGPADLFYELKDVELLPALIEFATHNSIPFKMIGRGSNILFTDKGFRGLIIKNVSSRQQIENDEITCDSGCLISQVILCSIEHNLTGLEPLFGLPGTIGGAVCGNAGVPNAEIGDFVKEVTVFDPSSGSIKKISKEKIQFEYRASSLQKSGDLILQVKLKLKKSPEVKSEELIKKINEIRRGKQPIGYSAGSFFKNPDRDKPAGLLIDQAGLKGFKIGDAEISEKHGNFFLNRGNATAAQILELAQMAKSKVKEKFAVDLEMEVKIVGDL